MIIIIKMMILILCTGSFQTLSEPVEALFLIDGPLFSRVVTVQSSISQTVTLYKTSGK